jgi:hypothetical protein
VVVSDDGAIIADRQIADGCLAIAIAGYGNADRVAEDKDHDLALLRIYGARGLKPLALSNGAAKSAVEVTGIADPQNQGGAAAVSSVKASAARIGGDGDAALSPPPALGFSAAECRARGAGGAGPDQYCARISWSQWRQCGGWIVGCKGVGGPRDLRKEVIRRRESPRFDADRKKPRV